MTAEAGASKLQFVSTSAASDGSFVAISEVGALLSGESHRLIGGVAVVLHQHRLGIDHPIRATADADFGVPPYALQDDSLIDAVAALGYERAREPLGADAAGGAVGDGRLALAELPLTAPAVGAGRVDQLARGRRSR